ncbi:MAG: hypothetical protein HRT88_11365, partial [Lentisphaeraceae bacterium]|nr:hypothetical protein [Lentisphaeraceae bacterium]
MNKSIKKIAMLTVARSDFGRQLPLMNALSASNDYELKLIVAGNHTSKNFGNSLDEIKASCVSIDKIIPCKEKATEQ